MTYPIAFVLCAMLNGRLLLWFGTTLALTNAVDIRALKAIWTSGNFFKALLADEPLARGAEAWVAVLVIAPRGGCSTHSIDWTATRHRANAVHGRRRVASFFGLNVGN